MRTLKKTLCLVLALVMCLGMFTVAFADNGVDNLSKFTDAKDVTYAEAADYLVAAGVVHGVSGDRLNPNGTLTRAEAATLVAYMMLGKEAADAYIPTELPFTDVSKSHWAAGYIQYAANEGYISGRGNGMFDPDANITGLEMASILLRVLGYGAKQDTTLTWPAGIQAKSLALGMFNDVISAASLSEVNRDKAFQMVFNTMTKIATVQYNASVGVYFTGTEFGKDQAFKAGDNNFYSPTSITSTGRTAPNTLGFKNYGFVEVADDEDPLGYPFYYWAKSNNPAKPLTDDYPAYNDLPIDITPQTTPKSLANSLSTGGVNIIVNGKETAVGSSDLDTAAKRQTVAEKIINAVKAGYTVDPINTDGKGLITDVIIKEEFMGEVKTVTPADGPVAASVVIKVFSGNETPVEVTLSEDDYDIGGLKEKDIVIVVPVAKVVASDGYTIDISTSTNIESNKAISVSKATPIVASATKYTASPSETVTFDNTTYNFAGNCAGGSNAAPFVAKGSYELGDKNTYDFYLNEANVVLGVTTHSVEAVVPNFVYITEIEGKTTTESLFGETNGVAMKAKGYLPDGKEVIFDLEVKNSKAGETVNLIDPADAVGGNAAVPSTTTTSTDADKKYVDLGDAKYQAVMGKYPDISNVLPAVYVYATNDKDLTTLKKIPTNAADRTVAGVEYNAACSNSYTGDIEPDKAVVPNISGAFANASTKLALVTRDGVLTYDGFAAFPKPKTELTTAKVFWVTTKTTAGGTSIANIVVVGATAPTEAPPVSVLALTKTQYSVSLNEKGEKIRTYNFVDGEGNPVPLNIADDAADVGDLDNVGVFELKVKGDVIDKEANAITQITKSTSTSGSLVVGTVSNIADGQIVVLTDGTGTTNVGYPCKITSAYDTSAVDSSSNADPMKWKVDTIEVGDWVVLVVDNSPQKNVTTAFILAN